METKELITGFRPLAGCGLFRDGKFEGGESVVSVPLRGVGCFCRSFVAHRRERVSVPLRGVGCFCCAVVCDSQSLLFPSPCGVWVVSKFRDAVQPV